MTVPPGEEKQLLRISGESAAGVHMTVTLFQELFGDATSLPPATAIVKWGNDGTQTQIEADFKQGAMITVPAGFVEIIGRNDDPILSARLGVFVAYLPYFKQFSATKTENMPAAGAGLPSNVVIPKGAISYSVLANPNNSIASINLLDTSGTIIGGHAVSATGETNRDYPLPNDARSIDVVASAIPIISGRIIFGLAL